MTSYENMRGGVCTRVVGLYVFELLQRHRDWEFCAICIGFVGLRGVVAQFAAKVVVCGKGCDVT